MRSSIDEHILYIFTDWASRAALWKVPKRVGGIWIFFVYCWQDGNVKYDDMSDYIGYLWSTNNDMELLACVEGLRIAYEVKIFWFQKIIVVSDSTFVVENSWSAIFWQWSMRWRTTVNGDPIVHKADWKKLTKYCQMLYDDFKVRVQFHRVKWHKDNEYNNMADKSAVKWAQIWVRKKISSTSVRKQFLKNGIWYKPWFLPLDQDPVYIHPYTHRPIKGKWYRCNYTLISWDHEYFNYKWWIYSEKALSSEYIYLITPKTDWSHGVESITSSHSKEEIRNKMLKEWYDESLFYEPDNRTPQKDSHPTSPLLNK